MTDLILTKEALIVVWSVLGMVGSMAEIEACS
jgi:hypothetical protein